MVGRKNAFNIYFAHLRYACSESRPHQAGVCVRVGRVVCFWGVFGVILAVYSVYALRAATQRNYVHSNARYFHMRLISYVA